MSLMIISRGRWRGKSKPKMDERGYISEVIQHRNDGWDEASYPFSLPAVKSWDRLQLHPKVTFFVGENGSGKSTLIEAIAVAANFNPEGGSQDHRFATQRTHSILNEYLRLARPPGRPKDGYFLRAETLYTQSTFLDQSANLRRYGDRPIHDQSHGEGAMAIFWHRFGGDGLYIMDEPEAALSPDKQLSFLTHLHDLVSRNSQFIIATHSPIILSYPDSLIYEFTESGPSPTEWENTRHVDLTRQFLNHPDRFLKILLEDDYD